MIAVTAAITLKKAGPCDRGKQGLDLEGLPLVTKHPGLLYVTLLLIYRPEAVRGPHPLWGGGRVRKCSPTTCPEVLGRTH